MRKLSLSLAPALLFIAITSSTAKAQTVLNTGDIAFSGYISNDVVPDQFSFVLLTNVTANTVIKFTDFGWRTDVGGGAFINRNGNLESELTFTTNAAYNAGTEITITLVAQPAPATATLVGGGSAGTVVTSAGAAFLAGSNMNLSASGDQIFAYQGTFAAPTFITGIHMNVYSEANGDPVVPASGNTSAANWDGVITTPASFENANSSGKPAALTTGTNAIWIGTAGNIPSEEDNGRFNCGPDVSTAALARAALNNPANWSTNDLNPSGFVIPTGCNYIGILSSPPVFTTHPSNSTVCEGTNTSFTIVATGAASYQWQVDNGGGFANITNNATYSGATATTLNVTAVTNAMNGYLYRCVATNGSGPTNSNNATLTVTPLPVNPTLLTKTPAAGTVADGTPVSATFTAGSGGTGCTDDYRYTIDGGATYLPYTPGSNISTTGLSAASGFVFIEGRRAGCSSLCQNGYVVLASWVVTPLPAGATTLNAGDIAFSGYSADAATDEFSFVLLRNIGPGTVINFTDNGYQAGALTGAEQTITWTSNASYSGGTEIRISGLTATLTTGGSAGTVTGTALSLITGGDQILAYRGTAVSPTFISGIHMNVFSTTIGDAVSTTAAAWDGTMTGTSASALPPGLTTGVNCIWIGTQDVPASEVDNAKYGLCSHPGTLGPITTLRTALNNQALWTKDDISPVLLPTGCPYLGVGASPPTINTNPSAAIVCETSPASFSITATGALTYQWQEDQGGGFNNLSNAGIYSGVTTTTLNISAAALSMNGYQYRCVATNGGGSTNSTAALLTVNALPVSPTLLAKTPAAPSVADGTPVSATFNPGSGGTGCADDFRYTTDGGSTYLPYTPGSNISTTGIASGSGFVFIEGRRASCSSGCQGSYTVLASWVVTPLPAGATTLAAGDIAFSAYASTSAPDAFSFVLLKNIGPGTVINFTDNGFQAGALTNVEQTVTWTSPAGGLPGGTEITISGLTAARSGGGSAGTVTGTALSLITGGDQILAYQGTAGAPIFISAIHMNVYSTLIGDPVTTTAAAWDGTATGTSASALPTGLTTGVNCIWIGTQDVSSSEHDNAKYGNCSAPVVLGSVAALRAALNNQAFWIVDDNTPPSFTQPTGCNYLNALAPAITVTGTPLAAFNACVGTPSAEQTFTVSGTNLTANIIITAPATLRVSLTSGAGYAPSVTLTQSGGIVAPTTIFIRTAGTAPAGPVSGNVTVTSTGAAAQNIPVTGTVFAFPALFSVTGGGGYCSGPGLPIGLSGSETGVNYQLQFNAVNTGAPVAGTGSAISFGNQTGIGTYTVIAINATAGCTIAMTGSAIITTGAFPVVNAPTVTQPSISTPTGTIAANAAGGTLEYRLNNSAYQPGNTFSGLTPGFYYLYVREQGTSCETPYIGNPIPVRSPGSRITLNNGVIVGTSPFQDSLWAISLTDYSVVRRLGPSLPGFTITGMTGLATDPTTGENYIIMKLSGVSGRVLGKINLLTGVCTQVGNLGDNFASITFRSDGQLFGATGNGATVPETLYLIDKSNGNKTLAAALGAGADGEIICFNPDDDFIYHWSGNGTVVYERLLSAAPYTTTNIPISGTTNGETFGAIYMGSNQFLTSNISSSFNRFTTTGTVTGPFGSNPDDLRGLVFDNCRSVITAGGPTNICATGGSVVLSVNGGAANFQWYQNGAAIGGETNNTYTATTAGVYNCRYTDECGVTDSVAAGIVITVTPPPTTADAGADVSNCGLTYTLAGNTPTAGTGTWTQTAGPGTSVFTNANSPTSGVTVSVQGAYTFTWTITNAPCPPSSDDVVITFANTFPVTLTCPINTTAAACQTQAAINAQFAAWLATASGTGGLNGVLTNNNTGAPSACGGSTTVTFTYTSDCAPLTTTCTATFTVAAPPTVVLFCPVNTTTAACQTQAAVDAQFAAWLATASASGGCNGVFTNNNTGAPSACGGSTTVTFTYTSSCAPLTTTCTATFTVTAPPTVVLTCPVNTTAAACQTQAAVDAQFAAWLATASASGGCNGVFTNNNTGAPSACGGSTTVTFTYTSSCAPLTTTCTATFTVTAPPTVVLTCPVNTTAAACQTQAAVDAQFAAWLATASGTGGCNGVFTNNNTGAPSACGGSTTVTFTYTSSCAPLTTTCTATFTVAAPPTVVLTCPVNTTAAACQTQAAVNAQFAAWLATASASGGCNGVLTNNNIGAPPACGGSTTVTFTYTSSCAPFTTTCTATFTVAAPPPVVITCPPAVTVSCASAVPAPNVGAVTIVGGCSVVITHIGDVISNQTCANRFTVTRTYRGTDLCGNFTECTQIITVNDITPPTVTCPAAVTVSCASAVPAPDIALVTATDNCAGIVTITHIGDVISNQTCPNRFIITRTYRATDVCGNFNQCTQIITVNDQTAPVVTCPANITVTTPIGSCTAVVNFTPTATDNCGGAVTITSVPASGFAFPIGTTTVTVTATDACGNSSTCSFNVTVIDAQLPVISVQPQTKFVCDGSNATFSVTATNALSYQWQQWNGTAWVNIAGATASTFTVNTVTVAQNTSTYRVAVIGLCTTVQSAAATLYVNPLPAVSLVTSIPPSLLPPQSLTITANVNPPGGSFAWFFNNTLVPSQTAQSWSGITVDGIGAYRVVYTDPNGCVGNSGVVNVTGQFSANLWVYPNPNNGQFQVRFYNQQNEQVTVSVRAISGAMVYQQTFSTTNAYTRLDINLGTAIAAGVYIVEARNSSGVLIGARRIVVRH